MAFVAVLTPSGDQKRPKDGTRGNLTLAALPMPFSTQTWEGGPGAPDRDSAWCLH